MRSDHAAMGLAAIVAVAAVATRGVDGPTWGAWATVMGAALTMMLTRDRGARAAPAAVRPAVLIPVKDNVATVGEVARRALAHGLPVYVVDDGSTDGSGEACTGAVVLRHPRNRGKGAALLTGMRAAREAGATHAICLDADGQHDPDDVPAFAAAVRESPNAIVAGVRDLSAAPGRSQFGRRFSNFWVWAETGWRVADSQCGFRAYPIDAVLDLGLGGSRYDLEVEVLTRAIWAGTPVIDLPCRVYYPPAEERVSSFDPLRDNARISLMNTRLFLRRVAWPPLWLPRIRQADRRWSGRSRGTSLGWRFLLALLRLLGRRPVYAAVHLLAGWYTAVATTPGIRAYANRAGVSVSAIYQSFAVALVDRVLFLLHGPDAFRYADESAGPMRELFDRGGILLTAHLGNTEVAAGGAGSEERMRRLTVLRFEAAADHGRELASGLPGDWQPRVIAVNRGEAFSTLSVLRELRGGAVVAMHGDRTIDDRSATVDFLGGRMEVPVGPYLLAALAEVPLVVAGCFKEGDGYRLVSLPAWNLRFDRARGRDEQLREWAQRYAHTLETWVRRWPEQWYNFHEVWK